MIGQEIKKETARKSMLTIVDHLFILKLSLHTMMYMFTINMFFLNKDKFEMQLKHLDHSTTCCKQILLVMSAILS